MVRRKLLRIFVIGLILAEMTTIAAIGVQDYLQTYLNGIIQYGCPKLEATTTYNNSLVHEVMLTCPQGPAVTISSNMYTTYEGPYAAVYPTFSPPTGLLVLFALREQGGQYFTTTCSAGASSSGYPNSGATFPGADNTPPLISGAVDDYYGSQISLDYCAVVKNNIRVVPFDVKWSYGYGGHFTPRSVALTAPNITVRSLSSVQYVNVTVSIKSLRDQGADTLLYGQALSGPSLTSWNWWGFTYNPRIVFVNPNGTNSTVLTLEIMGGERPGLHAFQAIAYPAYGLRFYGDYAPSYMVSKNSTIIYVQIT